MKKLLLFSFAFFLTAATLFAQAPLKMSYQMVIRNSNNTLVTNQLVSARITVLQGSMYGTPVYVETHSATTNANGLLTLEVGAGTILNGTLEAVNWANGPFYLKSEIDPEGGISYSIEGVQQLMSVPYALYAAQAGNVPAFGITPVDSGYVLSITQPGGTPQTYFLPTSTGGPGAQGPAGEDGNGIDSISGPTSSGLEDTYTIHYTDGTTSTFNVTNGAVGADGAAGRGIDSVAKTATVGNADTYTIYYSDNTTGSFTVTNGVDGAPGATGAPGIPGNDGVSPTITVTSGEVGIVLTVTDATGTHQYTIPNSGGSGGTLVQQQADWNTTDPTSVTYILNKPSLATVATSGSYNDLLDKPAIPTVPALVSAFTNDAGYITSAEVPTLNVTQTDTGYVLTVTQPGGTTQTYVLVNGKDGVDGEDGAPGAPGAPGTPGNDGISPTISVTTGDSGTVLTITDATGTHQYTIPSGGGSGGTITQQQVDWNATDPTSVTYILNKPTLATVATTGNYNDLTNKPTIPDAQVNADWNATSGVAQVLNKPELATVATTGSYNDLTNKPTIPAAQVNADWNATSGIAQVLNKPELATVATTGDYDDLENTPDLATVATTGDYDDLENRPTIPTVPTNVSAFTNDAGYITMDSIPAIPDAQVNADWEATSGVAEILNKPDVEGMQNTIDSLQNALDESFENLEQALGFVCGVNKVKDYDNNEYATVKIGDQCWLRENLRTTHYSDGTEIAHGTDTSSVNGYYYYPNFSEDKVPVYGLLYNWRSIMNGSAASSTNPSGVQGICPTGWHVPSSSEWYQLKNYVMSQEQYHCNGSMNNISKALADQTTWTIVSPDNYSYCATGVDASTNNSTGFSARAAGWLSDGPTSMANIGQWCMFFCSDVASNGRASSFGFREVDSVLRAYANPIHRAQSVRCVRDSESSSALSPEDVQNMINTAIAPLQNQIEQQQNTIDSLNAALSLSTCGLYTVKDYDNNEYQTIRVGNQCWMKENLRTTHYSDGTAIAHGTDTSSTTFYYYYPNNDNSQVEYGYLYNWPATMRGASYSNSNPSHVQGICPTGWHVPSHNEWYQMKQFLMNNSEYVCGETNTNVGKALASTTGWQTSDVPCAVGNDLTANNATGFSAYPAGSFNSNYARFGQRAEFWTTSTSSASSPYRNVYTIYYSMSILGGPTSSYFYSAYSVRCIKDL